MSKNPTINTLQLMRARFAQKIAESKNPETDVKVSRVYLPLYEISAVMLLAAQEAKKTDYLDSLCNRAALSVVKNQLKDLQFTSKRIHYLPGYTYADRIREVHEMQHDISVICDIASDLLA